MFIFRALSKRGPLHGAKVRSFGEMCNILAGNLIFSIS